MTKPLFLTSQLRQVTTGTSTVEDVDGSDQQGGRADAAHQVSQAPRKESREQICSVSVHDASYSKEDIVLIRDLFPGDIVRVGDLMQIATVRPVDRFRLFRDGVSSSGTKIPRQKPDARTEQETAHRTDDSDLESNITHLFFVKPMTPEMLLKQPNAQISLSVQVASAFHLVKGKQVVLSTVDKESYCASHVEIVFRDQYLSRAEMWRLINAELAHKCIYRGQKIMFMGIIRATVKSIFIQGKKVQSALFHTSTKPIFRSESARYVLFIQMSREMWDFDAEGTGEIMFDKVINGFLPELFKRWQRMKVRHLVSIVLFTRMLYDVRSAALAPDSKSNGKNDDTRDHDAETASKDFYRVVVSDMSSGEWSDILNQLKKEFKVFLRDISIRKPEPGDYVPLGSGLSKALAGTPDYIIAGHPTGSTQSNVLEAINLASSQFSSDYIDRDLVRTGVSIVVITPGAGLYEVDYNLLVATTDNLIDNGVGIDLVCLSKMPLHSVPLFKYKQPRHETADTASGKQNSQEDFSPSFSNTMSYGTQSTSSLSDRSPPSGAGQHMRWSYGIPHWIDVSFWNPISDNERLLQVKTPGTPKDKVNTDTPRHKPFIPRVRMYELQMMGVVGNAISEISIPQMGMDLQSTADATRSRNLSKMPNLQSSTGLHLSVVSPGIKDGQSVPPAPRHSVSTTSLRSIQQTGADPLSQLMDDYDDTVFQNPAAAKRRARKGKSRGQVARRERQRNKSPSAIRPVDIVEGQQATDAKRSSNVKDHLGVETGYNTLQNNTRKLGSVTSTTSGIEDFRRKPNLVSRQISFGLRGIGVSAPKAVASTELSSSQSPALPLVHGLRAQFPSTSTVRPTSALSVQGPSSTDFRAASDTDNATTQSSDSEPQSASRPIPIRKANEIRADDDGDRKKRARGVKKQYTDVKVHDRVAALTDLRESTSGPEKAEKSEALRPLLSPSTTLAPWLTILNPSNPTKTNAAISGRLGRWQHVFPRPPKTSQIKWKSLCSPAAVPLTSEDCPSADQLAEEYQESSYLITLPEEMDMSEHPRSLVNELLAFRLSRGFQIIVGNSKAEFKQQGSLKPPDVFNEKILADIGATIYLSRGSVVHQLTRAAMDRVEIKQYVRHSTAAIDKEIVAKPLFYTPAIRSMLADRYEPQSISIAPQRGSFNWYMIDSFIVGNEHPQAAKYVENLRPWRARFVLIPVESPPSARGISRSNEDNDEEIRLEGIRKLTQVWQRFRYVPPGNRRFQAPIRTRKDPNPLDITYQTKDPSAIVAAELENVVEDSEAARSVQLLPEPDLYQRSNLNIRSLAETIQSDKGVRMQDRRWHWRLHYNCFIGFELTTWLLQNFGDVETREEAEELGKHLMKNGLFQHVEKRHDFRDGNFFYQIASEYRTARPESRSWFGRGKVSVPPTPTTEDSPAERPKTSQSQTSSITGTTSETILSTSSDKKQKLSVALSKCFLYDVDHRRKSYRPELINLHYDRLHNPDNCYHIRVEWMNTTPRFIQDTVMSWATSVDRFGLRLVEVPIGEASSITSMHPFRAPYLIKLVKPPPANQPQYYFDSTAFIPKVTTEQKFYQKAIMKRFSFVLDFEAASAFPPDVDVTYSWGKPDYRYPQYIHRSGVLIAQITDSGDFLLLANRLYNNRSAANSIYQEPPVKVDYSAPETCPDRGPTFHKSISQRGGGGAAPLHRSSPRFSPFSSPSVRATLEVPTSSTSTANTTRGPSPTTTNPSLNPGFTRSGASTAFATPEKLTQDFQAFCNDAVGLEAFYAEVLSKASTPGSAAFTGGKTPKTPSKTLGVSVIGENDIPSLALPGTLVEGGWKTHKGRGEKGKSGVSGERSPLVGPRESRGGEG